MRKNENDFIFNWCVAFDGLVSVFCGNLANRLRYSLGNYSGLYSRRLGNNGGLIKGLHFIPNELLNFKPTLSRFNDSIFLTRWAEDRKKELLRLLGKNKGVFTLSMYDTQKGVEMAGSDYIYL